MDLLLKIVMPLSMMFIMVVVGAELSWQNFQALKPRMGLLLLVSACQLLLLPGLVILLFYSFEAMPTAIAVGMLVMAAGPGGGLSNMLTDKVGGNTALSITLTSFGSLLSLLTMPLVFGIGFPLIAARDGYFDMPMAHILGQLVLLMVLPICLGMFLRHRFAGRLLIYQPVLRRTTTVMLLVVVIYSLTIKSAVSAAEFAAALPYAVLFLLFCILLGGGIAWLFDLESRDTRAVIIEYSFQSAAIPTVIIASILQHMPWLVFIGAEAILQMVAVIGILVCFSAKPKFKTSR